jgi:hypothetical protein
MCVGARYDVRHVPSQPYGLTGTQRFIAYSCPVYALLADASAVASAIAPAFPGPILASATFSISTVKRGGGIEELRALRLGLS